MVEYKEGPSSPEEAVEPEFLTRITSDDLQHRSEIEATTPAGTPVSRMKFICITITLIVSLALAAPSPLDAATSDVEAEQDRHAVQYNPNISCSGVDHINCGVWGIFRLRSCPLSPNSMPRETISKLTEWR